MFYGMENVRLGIVGLGGMGTSYTKTLMSGKVPELELAAAADCLPESRRKAAGLLGEGFPVFASAQELYSSGLVDAVLIASPHYQHAELSIQAFEAGLHVLCDKPAGVYTKQARAMNEAAEKSGKVFCMMFNQRTNPSYIKMREMVGEGGLGPLMRAAWTVTDWFRTEGYYRLGGWRGTWKGDGGGALLNQCPHQLDLFQWIAGMPCRVRAFCRCGKWHRIEVEDDVAAYFEFPNGASGVFTASTGEFPGFNRFEAVFDKGTLVNSGGRELAFHRLDCGLKEFIATTPEPSKHPGCESETFVFDGEGGQHAEVMRSFAACILRGERLFADGREGINALTLSNAMYLSSWLDKAVDIPFDEDLFLRELDKRAIALCTMTRA